MTVPDWLAIGGFVIGGIGLVLSVVTYLFTGKTKALDLRLELRKVASDVRATVLGLPDLIDHVANLTERVAAARGHLRSGKTERFKAQLQQDREHAAALAARLPLTEEAYAEYKHGELESALVSIHQLKREANVLVARYERDLESLLSEQAALQKEAADRAQR